MHAAIQVLLVGLFLFFLSNPGRSPKWLSDIAPRTFQRKNADPSVEELYARLYEIVPERQHPDLDKAKALTIQFKQEVLKTESRMDYVQLLNLKAKIMTYLHQSTFFLPNDLDKELEIRAYIQQISQMLQGYLYQLFGTPFDDFGYSSMQDVVL